jgi:hypothetical protein
MMAVMVWFTQCIFYKTLPFAACHIVGAVAYLTEIHISERLADS